MLAERIREAVEALRVPRVRGGGVLAGDGELRRGLGAGCPPLDRESLIAAADAALYRAKRGGKNRVERALTLMPEPSSPPR